MTTIKTTRLLRHEGCTTVIINDADPAHRYQMSIPSGDPTDDGSLSWRMTYHQQPSREDIGSACSIMASFEWMLSKNVSAAEAIRRLRCLRHEYQNQHQST